MSNFVTATFTLHADDAYQLAQLCKRIGWRDCFELTEGHLPYEKRSERAYQMRHGIGNIRIALEEAGVYVH